MQTEQHTNIIETVEKKLENLKSLQNELTILITEVKPLLADPTVQLHSLMDELRREIIRRDSKPVKKRRYMKRHGHRKTPRHWEREEKLAILLEAKAALEKWGGVRSVCEKHKITNAHLTQWKQQLKIEPAAIKPAH